MLPGPIDESFVSGVETAETEEFSLPEVSLPLDRCRSADFSKLESIRGWLRLSLQFKQPIRFPLDQLDPIRKIFANGTILAEGITRSALAVVFLRQDNKLGVAWLPNDIYSQSKWVEVLVSEWAKTDTKRFPNFGDWTSSPEWMTPLELKVVEEIETLKETKQNLIDQLDKKIAASQSKLILVSNEINKSRRRLITAQNDDLVDEVVRVLSEIGFQVEVVDKVIKENQPKREDLRLTDPSGPNKDWEAIVEVRGYSRSSGKTNDFLRLYRFAELYRQEKGHLPYKQIYIVNGQLELSPSQRQEPLSSSTEDLQLFAESNGLVIWTLDLFGALKFYSSDKYFAIKNSIMTSAGRWDWRIQAAEI
jgi:hypothetical protein